MSDIEKNRTANFIKAYEETKSQSFVIESINKDFFFEFADCLIARIKELEAKLEFKRWGDLDNTQFEEYMSQFVSKQKVKDLINNETVDIFGFECIAIEDLEKLMEEK